MTDRERKRVTVLSGENRRTGVWKTSVYEEGRQLKELRQLGDSKGAERGRGVNKEVMHGTRGAVGEHFKNYEKSKITKYGEDLGRKGAE